jgi:hypothetical protein
LERQGELERSRRLEGVGEAGRVGEIGKTIGRVRGRQRGEVCAERDIGTERKEMTT